MKKLICVLIALLTLGSFTVLGYTNEALDSAQKLFDLGLFKGSSDAFTADSADLDSTATRVQIAVTITRMLGKEEKAGFQKNSHPFTDVPAWASDYVGYLYENYLVNGTGEKTFSSNDAATVKQFATMLLRVLGYSDSKGDFNYDSSKDFAKSIGLIGEDIYAKDKLSRGDMVRMCYTSLNLPIKNSYRTLGVKLLNEKVYTKQKAEGAGLKLSNMLERAFCEIPEWLPSFRVEKQSTNTFKLCLNDVVEHYGIRVFVIRGDSDVMKEVPYNPSFGYSMTKGEIMYLGGGGAGYVNELYVNVPDTNDSYTFMVLKTSSESNNYKVTGKSPAVKA